MPFIEGGAQTTTKKTTQPAAASGTAKQSAGNPMDTRAVSTGNVLSGPTPENTAGSGKIMGALKSAWDSLSAVGDKAYNANPNAGYITDPLAEQYLSGGNVAQNIGNPSSPVSGGNGSSGTVKPGTRTPGGSGVTTVTPSGSPGSDVGSASGSGAGSGTSGSGSGSGTGSGSSGGYGGGSYGGGSGSSGGGSGSGSGSGSSGGGYNGTGYSDATLLAQALSAAGLTADPYQLPTIDGPNPERLEHVDTAELQNLLQQIVDSQKQQANAQIDYGVEQGVNELTRAMEDAANQYQTQRNQATADELRALDNQALYAEARGDRGGIGEAQYASIQAAAAQNRRAVNDAQTKLGTDTSRQIADLRSKGEFQKADQLLSITQSYLKDLMGLEQWALEANLGVDEFNSRLQQWVDEYNLNVQQFLTDLDLSSAQLTGVFANGKQTAATKQRLNESLASSGSALLSAGVLPSRQQLEAMGMTETQAKAYIKRIPG